MQAALRIKPFLAFFVAACLLGLPGAGAAAGELDELLEPYDPDGPAMVMHVTTPDGDYSAATGRFELGGRKAETSDRFVIASVSKTYLAAAVLMLAEDGKLDLEDPVADWVDGDVAGIFPGLDRVTIAQLLTMTSGLPEYLNDDYSDAVVAGDPAALTVEGALSFAKGEPVSFEPGAAFEYTNSNYLLAQLVLEEAAGMPMHAFFEQRIFEPLGLRDSFVRGHRASGGDYVTGYEDLGGGVSQTRAYHTPPGFGDGAIVATAANVAAFFKALLIDEALLEDETLEMMLTPPLDEPYGMGITVGEEDGIGAVYGHEGADVGYLADVQVAPELGLVAVSLLATAEVENTLAGDALLLAAEEY